MMMTNEIKNICNYLPEEKWREFAYFSANTQHILGLPFGKAHLRGYLKLKKYNSQQALLDLRNGLPDDVRNDQIKEYMADEPALFVSFHYGAYRTLPLRILREGRSVCVLLSQDVYAVYSKYYEKLLSTTDSSDRTARLHLLPVEDPSVFFKLRKMVAAGMHVFVYADGAKGTFASPTNERLKRIQLLNGSINVRSGYLDFAYLLGLQVHLVLDRSENPLAIKDSDSSLFCYKLQNNGNRREFVEKTLLEIYDQLGQVLNQAPYRWEALWYLHRHCLPQSDVLSWERQLRVLPFSHHQKQLGLDRYTYRVHQLNP
ncbi:MAG: hypothetical protein ACTIK3_13980 [Sphingobacteriaceae bacterium]